MFKPKVSIVIPVYNGENFLKEAIDSALAQTYDNCEVIVVNDGSKDGTEEIALSYGDRIRYFYKENGGVASALNLGIHKMQGEYFSWLSHDDLYFPTKIEKQLEALKQVGAVEVPIYGKWESLIMPDGVKKALAPEYRFTEEELQNGVFPVLFGLIHGCAMLIHKSHFDRVGLFNEALLTSQDYDMWFRIFRNQRVIYIKEPLIYSRTHAAQGSNTIEQFQTNCANIQMDMVSRLNEKEIRDLFGSKYQMYYHMLMMAETCSWNSCIDEWLPKFLEEKEPEGIDYLFKLRENETIILYCAGKNGRRFQKELLAHGIKITAFCDSNELLWGTEINGVCCISPQELPKAALIIVTKDYPEELMDSLKKVGYDKVMGCSELNRMLYLSVPPKENVMKYFNRRTSVGE